MFNDYFDNSKTFSPLRRSLYFNDDAELLLNPFDYRRNVRPLSRSNRCSCYQCQMRRSQAKQIIQQRQKRKNIPFSEDNETQHEEELKENGQHDSLEDEHQINQQTSLDSQNQSEEKNLSNINIPSEMLHENNLNQNAESSENEMSENEAEHVSGNVKEDNVNSKNDCEEEEIEESSLYNNEEHITEAATEAVISDNKEILNKLEIISNISEKVTKTYEIFSKKNCIGPVDSKDLVYFEEMMTRYLIELDNVLANGNTKIKTARKEVVKMVSAILEELEKMRDCH